MLVDWHEFVSLSCVFYLFYKCSIFTNCKVITDIVTHTLSHTKHVTLATVHAQPW